MAIHVVEPLGGAVERTKRVLFQPFDPVKWLTLGFCAFLASLAQGGGGSGGNYSGEAPDAGDLQHVTQWVESNFAAVLVPAVLVVVAILAITALLLWLSCRGEFMFLDGVARNRGAVVEPWGRYRVHANRLFGFRFLIATVVTLTWVVAAAIVLGGLWPHMASGNFEGFDWTPVLVVGALSMLPTLAGFAVDWVLHNFVAPTMYLHDCGVMEAWGIVGAEVFAGHGGAIVLYLVVRVILSFVLGMVSVLAACLTCCLVAIPYIGTVILLPLPVFMRSFNLLFLEQFGDEWRFFDRETVEATEPA